MTLRLEKQGDTIVIRIAGQLVSGNRLHLKHRVMEALQQGERRFLVDFAETGYIDSGGLGVLVSVSKRIREEKGELHLVNLNDDLRTLFELTRLDTLFDLREAPADVPRRRPTPPTPFAAPYDESRADGEAHL